MKCVNPKCRNQTGQGMGYLGVFYNTETKTDSFTRWICSPCFNLLEACGMPKTIASRPQLVFIITGNKFRVVDFSVAGTNRDETLPWLYSHWIDKVGWRAINGVIQLYKTPASAIRECPDYPTSVFMPEEAQRIPPYLQLSFEVNE